MKTISFLISFLTLTTLISCSPTQQTIKSISCNNSITIQYDKPLKSQKISSEDIKKQGFVVIFLQSFNDSIKAFVNNKIYYDKFLKTASNSDNHTNYFGYSYKNDKIVPILKIESISKKSCFDLQINKKYKRIYVFLSDEGNWTVRFSNNYY
ncbi:hypothetical protein JJC03_13280 [Flavobacterium oreochromis]|uniref:hypothetical protein n=1 Tax=Flavobacterium oreochromis TaxID=2906078 RepID=UPI001CE6DE94|nr:hypothetical protein [Flavobacterium oreochromis]QYS85996.1 hypothetical protein JJC03_13280 [Flavobacterium oreochromis]